MSFCMRVCGLKIGGAADTGPDAWVWKMGHNKVLVCPGRCIWHMGSLEDPEDPLHLSYNKSRSQGKQVTSV